MMPEPSYGHDDDDSDDAGEPVCGSLIHFPPARCTRPAHHRGDHTTAEIPAPLSAVAARMVTESDRLDAERRQLRDQYAERFRRVHAAFVVLIVAIGVVGVIGIATIVGLAAR